MAELCIHNRVCVSFLKNLRSVLLHGCFAASVLTTFFSSVVLLMFLSDLRSSYGVFPALMVVPVVGLGVWGVRLSNRALASGG